MTTIQRMAAGGAPVAIVGIGCRFPGGIADAKGFWQSLCDGLDAITEIPPGRIDLGHFFDPRPATPGRIMSRWGGFVEGIEEIDAAFFGISPREAERLDPQQRLLLEIGWEAFEDAGQDVHRLEGSRTGVFVGQWLQDFEGRLFADPELVDFYMTTGSGRYAASGRLSYLFGLRGPSLSIDSACSSSLAAVHLAVRSIRAGESELALAGGANVILQPHITIAYSQSRMMAPDGRCKFGDASGNGYVRSDGAGLVVLKSLDRALADGDRIYAVIHGSAVNNDGRSSGSMGTPSRVGQEELLRAAYRDAGISPGTVGYVEAHGTGTRAGDPVELGALASVLAEGRGPGHRGFVGSVKTNIGHTEGAAGVAGLIKAALSLHHDAIPPSLHYKEPNPSIPWADMPLAVPCALVAWPQSEGPRIAGVSAFGIAGTNAHAVLGEAPARIDHIDAKPVRDLALLPLSAKSVDALRDLAARYAELLQVHAAPSLDDVCWSAATRRTPLEHRAVFVADDRVAMAEALRRYAGGEAAACEGMVYSDARPKIAFVCPGQGAQWIGMARRLAAQEPAFRAELARCDEVVRRQAGWSIVEQIDAEPGATNFCLDQIDVIQPVLVAIAIAYAALWRSLGVEPDAVVGHSMGEVAAAHIAGILDLDQSMRIICRRSALMRRKSGMGAMALVELSMAEARERLTGREDRIVVAVSNAPRSSVLSGEPDAVAGLLAEIERDGVFCRLVKVDVASHSPQMESIAADLEAELEGLVPAQARIPLHSTVLGREARAPELGASYWGQNLRRPVLFFDTVTGLVEDGVSVFVELGPHPVLLPSIEQTARAAGREIRVVACGRREESEQRVMLAALGDLWVAGFPVEWRKLMPNGGRPVGLPLYPWQRERHWVEAAEIGEFGAAQKATAKPDAESLAWLYRPDWQVSDPPASLATASRSDSSWLVLAADAAAGSAVAAALIAAGAAAEVASLDSLESALAHSRASDRRHPRDVLLLARDEPAAAYLPVRAAQALLGASGTVRPRLWFATTGSQSVTMPRKPDVPRRVSSDQAALWGAARVVAEEHPELWGGLVDLDPFESVEASAQLLARHLLSADGEDQVALRGNSRLILRLARDDGSVATCRWRADSAYLVTGGLGDIGLRVAQKMVEGGARRLVLMGRTALPPREQWSGVSADGVAGRRIAAVRSLEAAGAAVHIAAVDVGDEAQLRAFLERYDAEAWPRIRGVVHAAGSLENHLVGSMDRSDFDAVLRPKLGGAQLLDKLLPDLDVFVMFSSTGAFLAQPGQANYAAANAGLDALALDRHARGLPAVSIGWGVWEDTGLVRSESGQGNVAELARQGIRAFAPAQGLALFGGLCSRSYPVVAVLPIDWSVFAVSRSGRQPPLYRDLLAAHAKVDASGSGLRERLDVAAPAERRQILQELVRDAVGKVLKVAPSRIDPRKAMGDMGLGSLMAMELRNRLESALGRALSATLAWNYPTVEALSTYLAEADPAFAQAAIAEPAIADGAPGRRANGPAAADATADDLSAQLSQVGVLTDEDAMAALRAGKPRKPR